MRIAIIGATGRAGSRIAAEAVRRGHTVTGIVRNPAASTAPAGVTLVAGDATRPETIIPALNGHDAVVSSTMFRSLPSAPLLEAVRGAGVKRLLVVGGAGSLEVAPGKALIDTPEFPELYKPEASAGRTFLNDLRAATDLDWTFLSPQAEFAPGERTGTFRTGTDQLLVDAGGRSHISMEDYAIAVLDELESPKHVKARFTVGY